MNDSTTDSMLQSAADLLWEHWQEGRRLAELPAGMRPGTRAEGYAVQARLELRSEAQLFGWKIAATSQAGQAHIGVAGPLAGRLLAERAFSDGAELDFGNNHMGVVEPEFAFRMGTTLAPRQVAYSVEEVLEAVDTLHPALETPDSRYDDFATVGAAQLIADNACAHEFVLGDATVADWRGLDLAAHAVVTQVAGQLEQEGLGANVLSDPRIALTWLANELSGLQIPLQVGQVVTTGTCATPLPVAAGDTVTADFGTLGTVTLRFRGA